MENLSKVRKRSTKNAKKTQANTVKTFVLEHLLIIIFHVYLLIAFLLYLYGPLDYPKNHIFIVIFFLFIYQIFFCCGYLLAIQRKDKTKKIIRLKNLEKIIQWLLLVNIIFSIFIIIRHVNSFNPFEILGGIITGIINPSAAYTKNLQNPLQNQIGGGIFTGLQTLFSPIFYVSLALGAYLFSQFKRKNKIMFIIAAVFEVLSFTTRGTNSGVFKVGIIIITVIIIKHYKKILSKKNIKLILAMCTIFGIATGYFLTSTSSRLNFTTIPQTYLGVSVKQDHLFYKVSENFGNSAMIGSSYISQGFNGFSTAFDYPFETTYGFGSGRFALVQVGGPIDESNWLWKRTYIYKMSKVWNHRVAWHSIYTWFANDVSIPGVSIIMLLIGWLIGLIKKEISRQNIFAIMLMPLCAMMMMFFPANNFIFDNPLLFLPFISLVMFLVMTLLARVRVVI